MIYRQQHHRQHRRERPPGEKGSPGPARDADQCHQMQESTLHHINRAGNPTQIPSRRSGQKSVPLHLLRRGIHRIDVHFIESRPLQKDRLLLYRATLTVPTVCRTERPAGEPDSPQLLHRRADICENLPYNRNPPAVHLQYPLIRKKIPCNQRPLVLHFMMCEGAHPSLTRNLSA